MFSSGRSGLPIAPGGVGMASSFARERANLSAVAGEASNAHTSASRAPSLSPAGVCPSGCPSGGGLELRVVRANATSWARLSITHGDHCAPACVLAITVAAASATLASVADAMPASLGCYRTKQGADPSHVHACSVDFAWHSHGRSDSGRLSNAKNQHIITSVVKKKSNGRQGR